jgi:2-isopropylmalate synthase
MKKENLKTELGIHAHNDSGVGVANTLAAVELGVTQLHATINGFGERTGNTDLCQLVPNLILKKGIKLDVKLENISKLSDLMYTLSNVKPNSAQPFVGKHSFKHKGGIHVDAVMKGASYEHINPEAVGNVRDIVLSDLSGKANIIELLKKFNIKANKDDPKVKEMLDEVEKLEKKGYDIGNLDAEKYLLVDKFFGKNKDFFKIKTWKVSSEQKNGEFSEALITGTVDGKESEATSPVKGGPVDAIYTALKKLITKKHKEIEKLSLINYKVMIAQDLGAESSVRVYIEFKNGSEEWGTVGVSTNIIEASLEAIEKGFRYYLVKNY